MGDITRSGLWAAGPTGPRKSGTRRLRCLGPGISKHRNRTLSSTAIPMAGANPRAGVDRALPRALPVLIRHRDCRG